MDAPPVTELRRCADGKLVCQLETAEVTGKLPMPKTICGERARRPATDIYGDILVSEKISIRAKNTQSSKNIYAPGRRIRLRQRIFTRPTSNSAIADDLRLHCGADGRHGHGESLEGVPRCLLEGLARRGISRPPIMDSRGGEKYPAMDLSRAGIFGTSAGGGTRYVGCWIMAIFIGPAWPVQHTATAWIRSGGMA